MIPLTSSRRLFNNIDFTLGEKFLIMEIENTNNNNNNNNNNKDGGRGLIDVETASKTATIGLDHYLKHKEGQYPKQVLEHERSKAKNSISKNATKFKREVAMPENENREINLPLKMLKP